MTAKVFRAAVTPEQVARYKLPADADVKLSSSRASKFIREYGDQCWELDSMPEQLLIDEVTRTAQAALDVDALNRALAREKEDDVQLARYRAAVSRFVTELFREEL